MTLVLWWAPPLSHYRAIAIGDGHRAGQLRSLERDTGRQQASSQQDFGARVRLLISFYSGLASPIGSGCRDPASGERIAPDEMSTVQFISSWALLLLMDWYIVYNDHKSLDDDVIIDMLRWCDAAGPIDPSTIDETKELKSIGRWKSRSLTPPPPYKSIY